MAEANETDNEEHLQDQQQDDDDYDIGNIKLGEGR